VEGARVCYKLLSHFSFDTIGAKEKLTKENAETVSSPAGDEEAYAASTAPSF
jgi:hypothetical protein